MENNNLRSEEEIFVSALEVDALDELAAYLDEACGEDDRLRRRVEALLRRHRDSHGMLDVPPSGVAATIAAPPLREQAGAVIGPYKLLEQIGEGGFGVVYAAEQKEPVRRQVALKIIKPGMNTHEAIGRFESERQALAIMDHPNIAKVLDGGATESGRPYFVMDLVKGVPITEYCDEHHLTPSERLELFIPVCQAVQHAHQKGIIHRDIKPSNVLVTLLDGQPVPKVIDFGVAKATSQELTEKTVFTHQGQIIGTLQYMSPEQAAMSGLDIDTRSDIYSLGVLLYELLTGATPFDAARLRAAGYDEMRRIIREEEPPRPSTKISVSGDARPSIAAQRKIEPRKLGKLLRGDLDWIIMKALEKDRARRYETANGFAMDLERYLNDEPVVAGPPSAGYRRRKFARKHKGVLGTAAAFAAILIVGTVISTWLAIRATDAETLARQRLVDVGEQRDIARRALGETRAAKKKTELALADLTTANRKTTAALEETVQAKQHSETAEAQEREARETAEKRVAQIEKGNEILGSIFKNLDPKAEEKEGKPLRVLLGERLDRATRELEGEAVGDPLAVAKLQMTLGDSQSGLGYPEKAIVLFTKARATFTDQLGPEHLDTLASMNNLAEAYRSAGKLDLALRLHERTLELRNSKLGPEHADSLQSMGNLAGAYHQALPLLERTLELKKAHLGPEHPDTLTSMNSLAVMYRSAGKLDQALPMLEQTLKLRQAKLGPEHP